MRVGAGSDVDIQLGNVGTIGSVGNISFTGGAGSVLYVESDANIATVGQQVWMLEGDCTVYTAEPAISLGNLNGASAHWLSATTFLTRRPVG